MTLKEQLQAANIGDIILTDATRATCFVNAKRAGVTIKTAKVNDQTQITVGEPLKIIPKIKPARISILDQVKALSIESRLQLFEHFELCCGMNRGDCVCPVEVIEQPKLIDDRQAKLAALQSLISNPRSAPIEPVIEEWEFTSDKATQQPETGDWMRYQYIPNTKKRRMVQVDEDDYSCVKRVM